MMYKPFRNICDYGRSQELIVFAAVKVQCPVWILHLRMQSKDNDPFFPVDRAILSYMEMSPNANMTYLANVIGMDVDFVRYREKELKEDGMVLISEDGSYSITQNGERKYFINGGIRPDVTIYGDVVVDGLSLKPIDKTFYDAKPSYSNRRSEMIVPAPILGNDDPRLVRAVKKIEGLTRSKKEECLIEGLSHDYQIEGYELKSIDNVFVVLSYNDKIKKCQRNVFFKDRFIESVDCLSDVMDHYYIYLKNTEFHSSQGYVPKDGNPFVIFSSNEIKEFLKMRYELTSVNDEDFKCYRTDNPKDGYPLVVNVSESLLERSENPAILMNDAMAGLFDIDVKEGTYKNNRGGFYVVSVTNSIPDKLERYKALKEYVKRNGHVDMSFIKDTYPAGLGWRQEFIDLGLLEELEDVDISQYIRFSDEGEDDNE